MAHSTKLNQAQAVTVGSPERLEPFTVKQEAQVVLAVKEARAEQVVLMEQVVQAGKP